MGVVVDDLDDVGECEDGCPAARDVVDDADHPGFEAGAVRDEQVGVFHRLRLSRRRGEVVRLRPDRHDHLDVDETVGGSIDDVAEDVGRDDDRAVDRRPSSPSLVGVGSASGHSDGGGEHDGDDSCGVRPFACG